MAEPPSVYVSTTTPPVLAKLNKSDIALYLVRIGLPSDLASAKPSLELLSQLLLAHQLSVPYDVSNLHVKRTDWLNAPEGTAIKPGEGDGMVLGAPLFDRVVRRKQGSYCFGINGLFAALLRGLGFRVSEVGARVFMHRGKDPLVTGWWFSPVVHVTLLINWEVNTGPRYLVDAGFGGGGCAYPIPLQDGAVTHSLSPTESFYLKQEILPTSPDSIHEDRPAGYTLYRRVLPPSETITTPDFDTVSSGPGHWTACYHFMLSTLCPDDIAMANFYSSVCKDAIWMNFFACSILLKDGSRKTLSWGKKPEDSSADPYADSDGERKARLYVKRGIGYEESEVRRIKWEVREVRKVLEEEFGFLYD